jgi:hypothetical protein
MVINVLSDPGSAPIIVGDAADMPDLQAVGDDPAGRVHLVMKGHKVDLSEPASENFRMAKHLLLVDVEGDQVIRARKVRIDNIEDGAELTTDQCNALGKALTLAAREDDDTGSRKFFTEALAEFRRTYPELAAA